MALSSLEESNLQSITNYIAIPSNLTCTTTNSFSRRGFITNLNVEAITANTNTLTMPMRNGHANISSLI